MVKEFTREELEEQKEQLQKEIEKLNVIIEASDTSTFEIMIDDVKAEMVNNVAEENWKVLKANRSKVEKFREIVKIIQNQDELLEEKKDELNEVQWKLDHLQQNLFDQETEEAETTEEVEEAEKENECVTTGYIEQGATLYTGDVWKEESPKVDGEAILYAIIKSNELEGSFAIISNSFEGERLMQYPSNLKMLERTQYVGNIYIEDDDQENAIKAFDLVMSLYKPNEVDEG